MIIDLTICNFRSIKSEQTFSLYAEKDKKNHPNNITYINDSDIGVLNCAAILGANASGKSNLLLAFRALRHLIVESGSLKADEQIKAYEPYLLSNETIGQPVKFDIEFVVDSSRYSYIIHFTQDEIVYEKLSSYPTTKQAKLFERTSSDDWETGVSFGAHLKGGKRKYPFFANNSYLSKAGNSADSPELIKSIYNFFRNNLITFNDPIHLSHKNREKNKDLSNTMASILKAVDTGIRGIHIEDIDFDIDELPFIKQLPKDIQKDILSDLSKRRYFHHKSENGEIVNFDEEKESAGTLRLLNSMPLIIDALNKGYVLLCDELENSFHPHVVELIIKLFNDPIVNTKGAQLIFTTHSLSLLNPNFMRKDQIWLIEKNSGASELTSLDDFEDNSLRYNSPFSKWYDEGRLGGIPNIHYSAIAKTIGSMKQE